jgi:hypothetical protein
VRRRGFFQERKEFCGEEERCEMAITPNHQCLDQACHRLLTDFVTNETEMPLASLSNGLASLENRINH